MNRSPSAMRLAILGRHMLVALAGFACTMPAMANLTIPGTPLQLGAAIPPNVMVSFDDSGSMFWRYIYIHDAANNKPVIGSAADPTGINSSGTGDEVGNDNFSGVNATLTTGDVNTTASGDTAAQVAQNNGGYNQDKYMVDHSAATNGMYFNPGLVYTPWTYPSGKRLDNSLYTSACLDHNQVDYHWDVHSSYSFALGQNTVDPSGYFSYACTDGTVNLNNYVETYYVPIDPAGNLKDPQNYYRYQILKGSVTAVAQATGNTYPDGTSEMRNTVTAATIIRSQLQKNVAPAGTGQGCDGGTAVDNLYHWRGCVDQQTIAGAKADTTVAQNFANWFTYYQTRIHSAKAGLTSAFASQVNIRVGYFPMWANGAATDMKIPVATDGGLFEDSAAGVSPVVINKTKWFKLIAGTDAGNGTPLRSLLNRTGQYYQDTSSSGPYYPKDTHGNIIDCRLNFDILTTDGYWNGDGGFSAPGNDSGAGFPFSDTATVDSGTGTLADTAWYYWSTDLYPTLANKVPTTSTDLANWQHMTTYSISVGARGTLDPATVLSYIAAHPTGPYGGTFTGWPATINSDTLLGIDDLFHAAVNGHGTFTLASDPAAFVTALRNALAAIQNHAAAASNASVNSIKLAAGTQVFQSTFIPGTQWSGDLFAYPISGSGVVGTTPNWQASQHLMTQATRAAHIFSWESGAGVAFPTATQKAALGGTSYANYILGYRNNEIQAVPAGTFRNRTSASTDPSNTQSPLGDLINSSPAYVPGDAVAGTPDMVYVGGNDGLLRAINAATGTEMFDYVPGGLDMPTLATLTNPSYVHTFFVDGTLISATKAQTQNTTDKSGAVDTTGKNILVGVLGRGGNTVFALDVTDPANFGASKVLWEYTAPGMGLSLGTPIIAKLNATDANGKNIVGVIVGNGYNSTNGHSEVFVLNIRTGALVKELDTGVGDTGANNNGMSTPKGWDVDRDGLTDQILAGDMLGNLWELDISDSNPTNWTSVYKTGAVWNPVNNAIDSAGNRQPITSGVAIGLNPVDFTRWFFFGTGRFVTSADDDPTSTIGMSVQSWYGIQEGASPIAITTGNRNTVLKQRKIVAYGTTGAGNPTRAFESAVAGDMSGKKGWYVDLEDYSGGAPVAQGERIVTDTVLLGNILLAASIIPFSTDPCDNGTGFINAISPFTGGALTNPFFDTSGNGTVDNGDLISGGLVPGSIDLGVGMPSLPSFIQKVIVAGGSKGSVGGVIVTTPTNSGRISWREVIIGN